MSSPDHDGKPEEVERRTALRGPMRDLVAVLADGERLPVLEAGPRAVFVEVDDPDRWPLGHRLEVTVTGKSLAAPCKTEVVRKEIDPRRGVALLIVHMSPTVADAYHALFE